MQPDNPIVGGISLRIPAIQSPNYVAGVSGWTINVDGSAEFNNVTIRGTFITGTVPGAHVAITGGQILVFDSGNNVIAQIDSTGIQALASDGSKILIAPITGSAVIEFTPAQTAPPSTIVAAFIAGELTGPAGDPRPALDMVSPTFNGNSSSGIHLIGASADALVPGEIDIDAPADGSINLNGGSIVAQTSIDLAAGAWHNFAFSNGWTGSAGAGYRLVAAPHGCVQLTGTLTPGTKADGTTVFTLPVGFRPINNQGFPLATDTQVLGQSPHLFIQTNGVAACFGLGSITTAAMSGIFTMDR